MNYADNVMETTTVTSAATFTPGGAKQNYRAFTTAYADNTPRIPIKVGPDSTGAWELGFYTLSGGVLTRNGVISSSNANQAVTFAAGSKDVTVVYSAGYAVDTENAVTLTNKRFQSRTLSVAAFSATPAINSDAYDVVALRSLTGNVTNMSTNLTGTPVHGDQLQIDFIKPASTGTIGWGAKFIDSTAACPSGFVAGKTLSAFFVWSADDAAWRCVGSA